jgi:hypothetical protein
VEGHVQGITKPEDQDNQSLPLPHASHGPPPHSGEDLGGVIPPRHKGFVGVAEQQRNHAKHIGGAPDGWRNLAVMPGRNPALI